MSLSSQDLEDSASSTKKKTSLFSWFAKKKETKSFLYQFVIFFLLCCSYSILRNLKDTLILTASPAGAEIIPFLKVWGILPAAFFATWLFTKLCNIFKRETIFYVTIFCFLTFYLFFAFVIYPNAKNFHLYDLANTLSESLPRGFSGAIAMMKYWVFSLFYVISEIWSSLVLTVLFWGFVNDVTSVSQAKRLYGVLNIGSNVAPIVAGSVAVYFVNKVNLSFLLGSKGDAMEDSLTKLILLISLFGFLACILFYRLNRLYDSDKNLNDKKEKTPEKNKEKITLLGSLRFIVKSPYLFSIAILVLAFNASINFTDILWKSQLKDFFQGDSSAILIHMNQVTIAIGVVSTLVSFLFTWIIKKIGWYGTALLTPLSMAITAVGFFLMYFGRKYFIHESFTFFSLAPLALLVYLGSLQNCLSKAGKYSVFDATKEIAFLKRDSLTRLKAKSAIDGLGSGFGKSGSSLSYQVLLIFFGSLSSAAPVIAVILFFLLFAWFLAIKTISKEH